VVCRKKAHGRRFSCNLFEGGCICVDYVVLYDLNVLHVLRLCLVYWYYDDVCGLHFFWVTLMITRLMLAVVLRDT